MEKEPLAMNESERQNEDAMENDGNDDDNVDNNDEQTTTTMMMLTTKWNYKSLEIVPMYENIR